MKNFVVGAQLYSVRSLTQTAESLKETLKSIKAMGYNTCQLSGQNREIPDEAVADMLAETGVRCVVTHNSMNDFEKALPELIARHKKWNCKYAGLGAMPADYRKDAEGFLCFANKASEIAAKLKDEGLVFVYHNHAFEFNRFDGVTGMDILFDNFGDNAQFELDSFWIQAGGANPVDWFRKVNGRMEVAHFKDMRGTNDFNPVNVMVPVGEGNLNWKELKKACEETGVLYAEVEQDNASDMEKPLSQLEISAGHLKDMGFTL